VQLTRDDNYYPQLCYGKVLQIAIKMPNGRTKTVQSASWRDENTSLVFQWYVPEVAQGFRPCRDEKGCLILSLPFLNKEGFCWEPPPNHRIGIVDVKQQELGSNMYSVPRAQELLFSMEVIRLYASVPYRRRYTHVLGYYVEDEADLCHNYTCGNKVSSDGPYCSQKCENEQVKAFKAHQEMTKQRAQEKMKEQHDSSRNSQGGKGTITNPNSATQLNRARKELREAMRTSIMNKNQDTANVEATRPNQLEPKGKKGKGKNILKKGQKRSKKVKKNERVKMKKVRNLQWIQLQ